MVRRGRGVHMVADGVLKVDEGAVVHERRHHCSVAQWRGPKQVTVVGIPRDLLQTKVLVGSWPIEHHVPEGWYALGDTDQMLAEVAEHLIGCAGHAVTLHAPCLPEEEQCAPLLALGEGVALAAGEAVERRIGEDEGELKLSNRLCEVLEGNECSCRDLGERPAKELPILVASVQPA